MASKKIIHVDMDAFFASVEIRENPMLKDRPVAVGGDPKSRGVIATSNYVARKYGVRSAMPSWKAKKLCPDLIIIFPNFEKYKKESQAIQEIFRSFTEVIEPLSLDEAYLDVSEVDMMKGSGTLIAQEIRRKIWEERQLTASAGVAPNKFLAKIASEWNKPNGLFVITPEEVEIFVKPLPIEKVFGVGQVMAQKLRAMGIYTFAELQQLDVLTLQKYFGSRAWNLYELCRGIDNRPVSTGRIRKSLSVESTFSNDVETLESCCDRILDLYQKLMWRYDKLKHVYMIKKLFVKLKFNDFTSTTIENSLYTVPSISHYDILVRAAWERKKQPVRLIGLGFTLSTIEEVQLTLFS